MTRDNSQSVAALQRFARPRVPVERCELCSVELGPEHRHLVDPASHRLVCACDACALLFSGDTQTKFRQVPRRVECLPEFRLTSAEWEALQVPIGLAFFFYSSSAGKVVAVYPSPAGPTESLLALEAWDRIVENNPILEEMESDTEALLVNRVDGTRAHYVAPIDECYKLVGLIRAHWQGFSGGPEARQAIDEFFESLKKRTLR